ncbi:hypothetical protein [Streptomyces hydrogenans]|uniref:hypothetical protein n=1 Tax=Streptomyces hydrogenans TaxID=1873719 RepID=UPI0037FC4B61
MAPRVAEVAGVVAGELPAGVTPYASPSERAMRHRGPTAVGPGASFVIGTALPVAGGFTVQ